MTGSTGFRKGRGEGPFSYLITGFVLLLLVLCGLFYYKWGGAIRTVAGVRATGGWSGTADGLTAGSVLQASLFYFRRIWVALAFGLLIGATVRAFVSPRHVVALLGRGGAMRRQVAGGLTGTPLMLCSCCITPVFQSVYERGAGLGSALAVMLASPGLNPAALTLTFLLFPVSLGVARVAAALAAVFVLPPILERLSGATRAMTPPVGTAGELEVPRSPRECIERLAGALGHVSLRTIPLVIIGVLLSSMILPLSVRLSIGGTLLVVALVAALAVVLALPTFFEIPLGLLFLSVGAPGAAAAMLIAGPIVNLPSLLILARETRPKVAFALALGVWLLAVLAGLSVSTRV